MDRKLYYRGRLATGWYNFTESLAYVALHRPTPAGCDYQRIPYGKEKRQYFNLCTRRDLRQEKKPVLIYIHGGGWISGITEMRDTYVAEWAKKGFFTASISYTYAPVKTYPGQLLEIFAALDRIAALAEPYGLDLDRVVLAGESAGGYYIMQVAALLQDPAARARLGIDCAGAARLRIRALVSHCGCFDLRHLLDPERPQSRFPDMRMMVCSYLGLPLPEAKAFLESAAGAESYPHVTASFPPTFVISAARDWLRFEAYDLTAQLEALGIPHASFEGTGLLGNHAWTIATIVQQGRDCFDQAYAFVTAQLAADAARKNPQQLVTNE